MIYLAITQREDGGFYQNFWIDGRHTGRAFNWTKCRFPSSWRGGCGRLKRSANFDPYQMTLLACGFLIREGPTTAQERWEEAGGYSPSTLASVITALICAAEFMEARGDKRTADFVRTHADFLESHVERWTVTNQGNLVPGITRHYIRINPAPSVEGSMSRRGSGSMTWFSPTRNRETATFILPTRSLTPDFWNSCASGYGCGRSSESWIR